jgi:hypothetical protein
MLIGGVAASILGRPRMTRDVDALVWIAHEREWKVFLAGARAQGLAPRIEDALAFAVRSRVLLLRHVPSGIDVDISLAGLPFEEEAIARAVPVKLGRISVPLPRPEDLIVMKAVAHRPRDAADIEGILDAHPDIDRAYARRWVGEFASALEAPELVTDLEALFRRADEARAPQVRRPPTKSARATSRSPKRAARGKPGRAKP